MWYPLRRNGRFAQLSAEEQRTILAEHGEIGMRFGAADYVHDVRLACHGLDRDDNDFVIGLIGKDLFPLSAIVQVDAQDPADLALPRSARTVLRRPRGVADSPLDEHATGMSAQVSDNLPSMTTGNERQEAAARIGDLVGS